MVLIIKPKTMVGKVTTKKQCGTGMGSVLLRGSAGDAASLTNDAPTYGMPRPTPTGAGLGSQISAKLEKLRVQTKKRPENIKFSI